MISRSRILGLFAVVVLALSGCVGWSADGRATYLAAITVTTPNLVSIPDGSYLGSYSLDLPPGGVAAYRSISVEVAMGSGTITGITITAPTQLASGDFYDAIVTGPNGVIANQSLDVDAVSGASYSSKAFLKAVEAALPR
ncbi:MAG TPA: FMN-binding protein [Spirochaetia bacterium]|nr:FMN-binding protein [Spirochaetia bacterium]